MRETPSSGPSLDHWATQAPGPPRLPGAPVAAQAQVVSDLLCRGISSKALVLLTIPEGRCSFPTQPRTPLHTNPALCLLLAPAYMLAVHAAIWSSNSHRTGLELQSQGTERWERAVYTHPTGIPELKQVEGSSSFKKINLCHPNQSDVYAALKSTK